MPLRQPAGRSFPGPQGDPVHGLASWIALAGQQPHPAFESRCADAHYHGWLVGIQVGAVS
jgi:hypothetical protein